MQFGRSGWALLDVLLCRAGCYHTSAGALANGVQYTLSFLRNGNRTGDSVRCAVRRNLKEKEKTKGSKMKRLQVIWCVLSAGILLLTASTGSRAGEGDRPISLSLSVDAVSKYVWRGMLLTDDPVLQPDVAISGYGFTLDAWGSVDTTDINEQGDEEYRFQEVDYTLSYAFSPAPCVDVDAGVIYYDFPGTELPSTKEIYAGISYSGLPVTLGITGYHDLDESDGLYISAGLSRDFTLTDDLTLALGATLGWGDEDNNAFYFGPSESGIADAGLTAGLVYTLTESMSVSVFAAYSEIIDSDLEDAADVAYSDSDNTIVGLGWSFSY